MLGDITPRGFEFRGFNIICICANLVVLICVEAIDHIYFFVGRVKLTNGLPHVSLKNGVRGGIEPFSLPQVDFLM